jgi:hypothetical protein
MNRLAKAATLLACVGALTGEAWGQSAIPAEQSTTVAAADANNWLQVTGTPGNGDPDRLQIVFFEVPASVTSTIYFAVRDPGCDGDTQGNGGYDTAGVPDQDATGMTTFTLLGGSGTISSADSRLIYYGTPSVAYTGSPLASFSQGNVNNASGTGPGYGWVYFGGVSPSEGERIGNKYYFKVIVEANATVGKNAFQLNASYTNSGWPTGVAGVRSFAYAWTLALRQRIASNVYNLYPFVADGDTGNVAIHSWDMDGGESLSLAAKSGYGLGALTVSGNGTTWATSAAGDTFSIPTVETNSGTNQRNGTWAITVTENANPVGTDVNPAVFWASNSTDTAWDGETTDVPRRIYAAPYAPNPADHVTITLEDGAAKADGIDQETVTLQLVDSAGTPVSYVRTIYVKADKATATIAPNVTAVPTLAYTEALTTNADGMVTFTIIDTAAETVTITLETDGASGDSADDSDLDNLAVNESKQIVFSAFEPPTMASSANNTENISQANTAINSIVITEIEGGNITVANDIRIKLPASLTDTSFYTSAAIGASVTGTATGVVDTGSVNYESAGGTNNVLVLPVTTPFATGDILTISGIELVTGTVESSGRLTLSVNGGGSYPVSDTKVLTVTDTSAHVWWGTTSTNWSTGSNWNLGTVPGAGATVIVRTTTNQPALTAATATLASLTIDSGATLTAAGFAVNTGSLAVNGTLTSSGTITASGAVNIAGTLTSSGTITASGNVAVTGTLTTTGTVTLSGNGAQSLTTGGTNFTNLQITTGTDTTTVSGALNVSGTLTIGANQTLALGSNDFTIGTLNNAATGAVTLTGLAATHSITTPNPTAGTFNYTATAGSPQIHDFGSADYFNLTISGSSTDFALGADLRVAGALTMTDGTITAAAPRTITAGTAALATAAAYAIDAGANALAFSGTSGTTVGLGAGAGTLSLDNAELALIRCGGLTVGATAAALTASGVTAAATTNTGAVSLNTATSGALNLSGANVWAGGLAVTAAAGGLSLGANQSANAGSIAFSVSGALSAGVTLSAPSLSAAGFAMGANALRLSADEIELNSTAVTGTGALTIDTATDGYPINIRANATDDGAALDLNLTDLQALTGTYSLITIGRDASASVVTLLTAYSAALRPLTFEGDDATADLIRIDNALTNTTAGQGLSFSAPVRLGANLTTNNGAVAFNRAVAVRDSTSPTVASGGGTVTFAAAGTVDGVAAGGNESLVLNAGTGTVSFGAAIGGVSPLYDLTVTSGALTLPATTLSNDLTATTTGAVGQSGTLSGADLVVKTLGGFAIDLPNPANHFTGSVDLRARNAGDLLNAAGAITYVDSGDVAVAQIGTTSTVALTATAGAISQAGIIEGSTLTTSSTTGTVLGSANVVSAFTAANATSGAISLVNGAALTVPAGGVSQYSGGIVTLTNTGAVTLSGSVGAGTGSISIGTGGAGTITRAAGALTADSISLQTAASSAGAVGVFGTPIVTATSNPGTTTTTLNLGQGTALLGAYIAHTGALTLGAPSLAVNAPLSVIATGLLTLPGSAIATGTSALYLQSGSTLGISQNLSGATVTLIAAGAITQTAGTLSGTNLAARTINTPGAAITLDQAANDFDNVSLRALLIDDATTAAGAITYVDADGFDVAAAGIRTTGLAALTAGGAATDTGTIAAGSLALRGAGSYTLNSANAVGTLAADLTGGLLNFTNGAAFEVTTVDTLPGIVLSNSGSALTLSAGANAITLTQGLATNAGTITLSSPISLNAATVNVTNGGTAGAKIDFQSTVVSATADAYGLSVTAGTSDIDFDAAVGGTALASLTVVSGATTKFGAAVTTAGFQSITSTTIQTYGTHTAVDDPITFTGNLALLANTVLSAGTSTIGVTGTINGNFTLSANATGLTTFGGAIGTTTGLAGLTTNAAGGTSFSGGTVRTQGGGAIVFNDQLQLSADAALDATNGGGYAAGANVTLAGGADGNSRALSLNCGTGGVLSAGANIEEVTTFSVVNCASAAFAGSVGVALTPIGTVALAATINTANAVAFNGGLFATDLTVAAGVAAYDVTLGAAGTVDNPVTFSNGGDLTISAGFAFTGGAAKTAGGTIYLAGTVSAADAAIDFSRPITLTNTAAIDTGAAANAAADITVGAVTAATYTLTLETGALAGADVTGTSFSPATGTLALQNIGGTASFTGNVTASDLTVAGTVNNVSLTGAGTTIASDVVFANTGTLTLSSGGTITFSGGVTASAPAAKSVGGTISAGTVTGVIDFSGNATTVTSTATLGSASSGQITLGTVTINSGFTLTLGAGGATPIAAGAIGTVAVGNLVFNSTAAAASTIASFIPTSASSLTVTNVGTGGLTFSGDAGASGTYLSSITFAGTISSAGTVTFNGAVYATAMTVNTAGANNYSLAFNAGGAVTGNVAFNNGGSLSVGNAAADSFSFAGGATKNNAGAKSFAGTVSATNAALDFGGTGGITLADDTILDTNATAAAAALTLSAVAGGTNDLTLESGTGANVSGTSVSVVGTLTLQNIGGTASFTGAVSATTLTVPNSVVNVSLAGSSGTISNLVQFHNTGTLRLGATAGALTFSSGLDTTNAPAVGGTVTLYGTVQSANAPITFGAFTLGADTVLNTAAATTAGDLTIGTVTGAGFNLTLQTGAVPGADVGAASVSGVGTLALQNIGGTAAFTGAVSATALTVPNSVVNVSLAGSSGTISNLVQFHNTGTLRLGAAAGALTFSSGLDTTNAPAVGGTVTLYGTVQSANAPITFGAFTLGADTILNTAATSATGAVTIGNVTGGAFTLSITTGTTFGSVNQSGGSIAATYLQIITGGAVGAAGTPLSVAVDYLEISAGGLVNVSDAGGVTVGFPGIHPRDGLVTGISTGAGGALTLASTGTVAADEAMSANGAGILTVTANLAGAALNANAALSSTSGNLILTADVVAIGAALTSTGSLTLRPLSAATTVSIGAAGATHALDDAELLNFTNGFSGITLGRNTSGAVDVTSAAFLDPVTILGNGTITVAGLSTTQDSAPITVTASGVAGITVTGPIGADGAGAVTLSSAGALAVNAAVSSGSGNLSLIGGTGVFHDANGDLSTTGGTIGVTATANSITMADGTTFAAGAGDITLAAATNIALGAVSTTGTVSATATAGAITDATAGEGAANENIAAGVAVLSAAAGIGANTAAGDIDTALTTLRAAVSGAGGIYVAETNGIALGNATSGLSTANGDIVVAAGGAVTTGNTIATGTNGDIDISTTAGNITISNAATANGSGGVTLSAAAALAVNAAVSSTSGNLSLTGSTGVSHDANGDLSTTLAGTIGVTATANGITMADGTTFAAGAGNITLAAATNIALGAVSTTGTVSATATAGAITDATAGEGAANENIAAGVAVLSAAVGIGANTAAGDIDTALATLRAAVSGAGGIYVAETNGIALGNATSGLSTANGDIIVAAGGAVTTGFAIASGTAGDIDLTGASIAVSNDVSAAGTLTIYSNATHTAGTIQVGAGGAIFMGDYAASLAAVLVGYASGNPDIEFQGDATLASFTHDSDPIVFSGSSDTTFDSNGQVVYAAVVNKAAAIVSLTSDTTQRGPTLAVQSGGLALSTYGWIMDSGAGTPTANTFTGVDGTLTMSAGTTLSCGNLTTAAGHTISNPGLNTITVSVDASVAGTISTPTNSTLEMTGSGPAILTATTQIGNLTVAPGASVLLANGLTMAGNMLIDATGYLDVDIANNYGITIAGDWTNTAEAGSGIQHVVGNPGFEARQGTVTFTKASGTISISGSTTWWNFICQIPGITIAFSNNLLATPDVHTFVNLLRLRSTGADIVITKLTANGDPSNPPSFPAENNRFWFIDALPTAALDMDNVTVYYSNASLHPIIAQATVTVAPYTTYFNYKWLSGLTLVYSYTEDSDRNGKIDRIRVQAAASIGNDFSGFQASVNGYNVAGYSRPTAGANFYILLVEKSYPDTEATPTWTIVSNTTLADSGTGTKLAQTFTDPVPMVPVDTAQPRIAYTMTIPGTPRTFVRTSEPFYGAVSFTTSGPAVSGMSALSSDSSGADYEYLLTLGSSLGVGALAAGATTITAAGAVDAGIPANNEFLTNSSLPEPTYPTVYGDYSAYVVYTDGSAKLPPNQAVGNAATHRISDVLISVPPASGTDATYFVWPIWARDSVNTEIPEDDYETLTGEDAASLTVGLVRDFTGTQWLRDQNITLEARVNPALSPSALRLHYDTAVSDDYIATTDNVGSANASEGLWLPVFSEAAYSALVPEPNAGTVTVDGTAASAPLWDFAIDSKNPKITTGVKFDFFFTLGAVNATDPLYAARLDIGTGEAIPAAWYRRVLPFSFDIHDVKKQRSNVTILNNVINPTKGERTRLSYQLRKSGRTTIQVFTLDGDLVKILYRGNRAAGDYTAVWDGKNQGGRSVARGIYFIRIVAPEIDEIRKVMVVK